MVVYLVDSDFNRAIAFGIKIFGGLHSTHRKMLDRIQYEDVEKGENVTDGTLYAVKKGILDIGGYKLTVYILNDGQRIIDANDFENFLTGNNNE